MTSLSRRSMNLFWQMIIRRNILTICEAPMKSHITSSVSKKMKRIDLSYVSHPLNSCNNRCLWQGNWVLCEKKVKTASRTENVEGIIRAFVYPRNVSTVSWVLNTCVNATSVPKEERSKPPLSIKITIRYRFSTPTVLCAFSCKSICFSSEFILIHAFYSRRLETCHDRAHSLT